MILDRQEQLEAMGEKASDLEKASGVFRKNTRALRRWHLMNQGEWRAAEGGSPFATAAAALFLGL